MRRFISRSISVVMLFFMMTFLLSGCGILRKLGFGRNEGEMTPTSSISISEEEAAELADKVPIHLYFADENNEKLKLEIRYIPISEAAKSVSHLASIVVEELINGPSNEGLRNAIPTGTRLLSPVAVNEGVATVNLSKEFVDNHPGGKAAEQMSIYSIVNSLTELKDISAVTFTIEGEPRKDLKGSFAFDLPFPRSVALISTEVEPADQVSKNQDKKDASPSVTPDASPTASPDVTPDAPQNTSTDTSQDTPSLDDQGTPASGHHLFDEETGEMLE